MSTCLKVLPSDIDSLQISIDYTKGTMVIKCRQARGNDDSGGLVSVYRDPRDDQDPYIVRLY